MTVRIEVGDSLEVLRGMPDHSVHCVITSPPYWGLRDYGGPSVVRGGDPECDHAWGWQIKASDVRERATVGKSRTTERFYGDPSRTFDGNHQKHMEEQYCTRCGAWRGQVGLEPSFEMFLDNMVELFRDVRRVLRPDGTCWVNMGDSYVTTPNGRSAADCKAAGGDDRSFVDKPKMDHGVLRPKQRMMQPARLALALQADGWWLRDEIVWHKPNPMPSSVKDRTTPAHEMIHVLAPSPRYFFDPVAIAEPVSGGAHSRRSDGARIGEAEGQRPGTWIDAYLPATRNKRSVWKIPTAPFAEAHFATFPPALVEPCILAGTSAKGVCPDCGASWVRVTEKVVEHCSRSGKAGNLPEGKGHVSSQVRAGHDVRQGPTTMIATKGFAPSCACPAHEPIPATVLDPFGGAGTVGLVAERLGRDAVLIEIKQDYADMARTRIRRALGRVEGDACPNAAADLPLFAENQTREARS